MKRISLLLILVILTITVGCSLWPGQNVRSQSPEEKFGYGTPEKPRLVGDIARPFGLTSLRVEGIAICNGLDSTGSDPPLTKFRQMLFRDLKKRGISDPTPFIASKNTSLVLVRAVIPPGAQKGQQVDIEVQAPQGSETTSLRGGWLMETELREMAYLDDSFKSGDLMASATGAIMTPPKKKDAPENDRSQMKGLVLGGGKVEKSRNLGLILPANEKAIMIQYAKLIQNAVNRRFHITGRGGATAGVAKAKNDRFIKLYVHPRYKNNIYRYMAVVRSVAISDSEQVRSKRLSELKNRLLDPITAVYAALELEAIGPRPEVLEILREGMASSNIQVRFYSAETLAFLDQGDCADVLAKIAKEESFFRANALGALAALDDINSYEVLLDLLKSDSFETRYSAFRSLWFMRPSDPISKGITLGKDGFTLHYVECDGPNLIHITKDTRPEIVLFGKDIKMVTPLLLDVGKDIMLKSDGGNEIQVSKFTSDQPDQKRTISSDLSEVIKTVADLGATYPEVVELIQNAVADGAITTKVLVNAVPKGDRSYRMTHNSGSGKESDKSAENDSDKSDLDTLDSDKEATEAIPEEEKVSDEDLKLAGETPLKDAKSEKIESHELEEPTSSSSTHKKLSSKSWYKWW